MIISGVGVATAAAAEPCVSMESAASSAPSESQAPEVLQSSKDVASDVQHFSQFSVGSAGHPHSCAAACRYVKRRGGCREGIHCTKCHLCFWRRDADKESATSSGQPHAAIEGSAGSTASSRMQVEPSSAEVSMNFVPPMKGDEGVMAVGSSSSSSTGSVLVSVGTLGHPQSCGPPCRYVRRKGGCRDGANCPNCHACHWCRELPADHAGGVGRGTRPGFFAEQGQTLQGLIQQFLEFRANELSGSSASRPAVSSSDGEGLGSKPLEGCVVEKGLAALRDVDAWQCEMPCDAVPGSSSIDAVRTQEAVDCPSIGSVGHPYSCRKPCKYHRKATGCREGQLCVCCHLCEYQRHRKPSAAVDGGSEM